MGHQDDKPSPQKIVFFNDSNEVIDFQCGSHHTLCLTKNGLFSWGNNDNGQLGLGHNTHQYTPQKIEFFKNPFEILNFQCGGFHNLCLTKNGFFSWGFNGYGQLGLGHNNNKYTPQKIEFFKNPFEILNFQCGNDYNFCITQNGFFTWGYNSPGNNVFGYNKNQHTPKKIEIFEDPYEIINFQCTKHHIVYLTKRGLFVHYIRGRNEPYEIPMKLINENLYCIALPMEKQEEPLKKEKRFTLLCGRSLCEQCPFFKDNFPLDMFKIIMNLTYLY